MIRPPIVDPDFQDSDHWLINKTLYDLCRSPHHWYNIIKGILLKMGLNLSPHYHCLLSGVLANPSSSDIILDLQSQIHVVLYVNNFLFYSSDPAQDALFKTLLQEHIQVNFMGNVDYFLGTAFTWIKHDYGNISVHLCQLEFTEFTAHRFSVHTANKVPNMTPYRSGFPINFIPPVEPLYHDIPC